MHKTYQHPCPLSVHYISICICIDCGGNRERKDAHWFAYRENSEREFRAVRPKASKQPGKGFPPDIMKPFAESFASVPSVLCPTWHPFVTNSNEMLAVVKPAWGQKQMQGRTATTTSTKSACWSPHSTLFPVLFLFNIRPHLSVPAADGDEALHSHSWWVLNSISVQSVVLREPLRATT